MGRLRSRRRAEELQQALERYERALASGTEPEAARREIVARLGEDSVLLSLAVGMSDAAAPMPEPRSVELFAARLRSAQIRRTRPRLVRRPSIGFAPLALAACTVLFAALLVPSLRSLPGERLYPVKSAAEDARVWFASGPAEARVRLGLARERFSEVEGLIERSRLQAAAVALGASGLEALAAGSDIDDPELGHLIEITLAEAGDHIEAAAEILTTYPVSASDLDALVDISKQGRTLAAEVADDLPNLEQPPVLDTVVKLTKIEAKAKAARMSVRAAEPTPGPCATPSPTPEPTEQPADGSDESATDTAVESATPEPEPDPEATPCISPSPTPSPAPTEEPVPAPEPEPSPPPPTDDANASAGDDDTAASGVDGSGDGSVRDGNNSA